MHILLCLLKWILMLNDRVDFVDLKFKGTYIFAA